MNEHYDVVVIGAGLAGLTLTRHLLLDTDKRVLLLERRPEVPTHHQKVGESTVQVAGYYLSKVLDLEEYLMREHFMKYNLRFYWRSQASDGSRFEDYSQSYIRRFSNVASYQLDRNTFEAELLRLNRADERCTFAAPATKLEVDLAEDGAGPHALSFLEGETGRAVTADWVVDTTGRWHFLARRMGLKRKNPIRHGSVFLWVDGLVDIDKLTDASRKEIRLKRSRHATGHLPSWLATNHFMDEGLWFWVIPLQGKTSLGLVFDHEVVDFRDVSSPEKLLAWVCERFPLFARDLPRREILDFSGLKDFSHDCAQTISPARWALAGEAGRFTDPFYSPGSDLIAVYNTLIVDAIETTDPRALQEKVRTYEQLMKAVYEAYVPTYATSYDALGDQEVFSLKYGWELTIYFAFYVFPFVNDLLTDRRFLIAYLRRFAQLGPWNRGVQALLSGYFQWKKANAQAPRSPRYFDFLDLGPLSLAETTFYRVGVTVDEARKVLDEQLASVEELGRFLVARIASVVLDDPALLSDRGFVEAIDLGALSENVEALADLAERRDGRPYEWPFDALVLEDQRPRLLDDTVVEGPLGAAAAGRRQCQAELAGSAP